jgi:hypothetical protein
MGDSSSHGYISLSQNSPWANKKRIWLVGQFPAADHPGISLPVQSTQERLSALIQEIRLITSELPAIRE